MSVNDLIERLAEIKALQRSRSDIEVDHILADEALLQYINDDQVTELYESLSRWYS